MAKASRKSAAARRKSRSRNAAARAPSAQAKPDLQEVPKDAAAAASGQAVDSQAENNAPSSSATIEQEPAPAERSAPSTQTDAPQPEHAPTPQPAAQVTNLRRTLGYGEAVPLCITATRSNPRFAFGSLGGRYTLLGFLPPRDDAAYASMMEPMGRARGMFHAAQRVIALATSEAGSLNDPNLMPLDGALLVFHDAERGLHDTFGVTGADRDASPQHLPYGWFLIDPVMRIMGVFAPDATEQALNMLEALPDPMNHAGSPTPAPVMIVPRVFEPGFCQALLQYYEQHGGNPSGVTRERNGKTLVELDNSTKKRFDCMIEDEELRKAAMHRIYWRLAPQIQKAYQFKVTRMERYIVCCYDANSGGYFKAHRDNTTKGTAHRRFAVSINLNAEDFGGGGVSFPEYSRAVYNPPTGGALVFSCSLLHEALPITNGRRFAFLPFLYDDEAAEIRRANNAFLDQSVGNYAG
ncbi:MAG: 2OG-Fe(II) oxygenase [Pseudomonadota bacterium]